MLAPKIDTEANTATVEFMHACRVRSVLLKDLQGIVQVVLPADHLLDLRALHNQAGRELLPLCAADMVIATRKRSLRELDGAPGLFLLPTVLDSRLGTSSHCHYEIDSADGAELQTIALDELWNQLRSQDLRVTVLDCSLAPEQLPEFSQPGVAPGANGDVEQISKSVRNFTSLRIRQRLDETLEMPPLTHTAQRILKLRANPAATMGELTDIVEGDPALAAQVVSWAASPYYAARGSIRSVQDAIVRVLGFDQVSNLALGLAMGTTVALPRDRVSGITPYWMQSIYCSTAVEAIVRQMTPQHRPTKGMAYLAGLLHNFGYLVLARTFPPHFSMICRYAEANPAISHVVIETLLIGITREQIGALLMQLWSMPEEVCVALRHQHDAGYQGEHSVYAHLIFIALRLLRQHGIGDGPVEEIQPELYARYGLDPVHVRAAVELVVESEEIRGIAESFPVDAGH